jgi:hypothetical protein
MPWQSWLVKLCNWGASLSNLCGTHSPSGSAGPTIDIGSVIDRDYLDESLAFVNSVDHSVWTASRTPEAL